MEMDIWPPALLAMYLGRSMTFWSIISIAIGIVMQHVVAPIFRCMVEPASTCCYKLTITGDLSCDYVMGPFLFLLSFLILLSFYLCYRLSFDMFYSYYL